MNRVTTTKKREDWRHNLKAVGGLRSRYANMHPLLFQRCIERATSAGEAFDLLEGMPATFPVMWDDVERRWSSPKDLWLEPEKAK